MTVRDSEPVEKPIWRFASDGTGAENTRTGARISFLGIDKDGPVFRDWLSLPETDLRPLMFHYSSDPYEFELAIYRKLAVGLSHRGDTTLGLFWLLDLNSPEVRLASTGRTVTCKDLGELEFRVLRNALFDALALWDDFPDEVDKFPARHEPFDNSRRLPRHELIVRGGFMGGEWNPDHFRATHYGSNFWGFWRGTNKDPSAGRTKNWRYSNGRKPFNKNKKTGVIIRFIGDEPTKARNTDDGMFSRYVMERRGESIPLWASTRLSKTANKKLTLRERNTAITLDIGKTAGLVAGLSPDQAAEPNTAGYRQPAFTEELAEEIITEAGDAFLHWPVGTDWIIPTVIFRGGYANGEWRFLYRQLIGWDFSAYDIFGKKNSP